MTPIGDLPTCRPADLNQVAKSAGRQAARHCLKQHSPFSPFLPTELLIQSSSSARHSAASASPPVTTVPELSRFFNIVIRMLYADNRQHNKPHVHVFFAEHEASVGIDGELLAGSLPVKQMRILSAWLAIHEEELYAAWNKAVRNEPPGKIDPLS